MGPARRPEIDGAPAAPAVRRVLFVTGRLAEPALRRTLADMAPPFAADVAVLKITVAALMTTPWIARFLEVPPATDLVLIPGLCEGDPSVIEQAVGVRAEKGPKDLREIPRYFGQALAAPDYGGYAIEILAEINNAPGLPRDAIRRAAQAYRASGADVIDLGCTPGVPFPALAEVVRELRADGFRVPGETGCDRSGEPNAELREGPRRGPGSLHGCRGRDPDAMILRPLRSSEGVSQ